MTELIRILDPAQIAIMYYDWINNFLTVPRFAEYYGISEELALYIIEQGKKASG